jgi:hypothetical protein
MNTSPCDTLMNPPKRDVVNEVGVRAGCGRGAPRV